MMLRLIRTDGKNVDTVSEQEVTTGTEALAIVEKHAAANGMTRVKVVDAEDSLRYTATTPGGRAGRNIAFLDF